MFTFYLYTFDITILDLFLYIYDIIFYLIKRGIFLLFALFYNENILKSYCTKKGLCFLIIYIRNNISLLSMINFQKEL
jgi:hypothetical protein